MGGRRVRHESRGDYTGKFADPFYGYDPTVEIMQKTTSWALFAQDDGSSPTPGS
jgi:hypothetical protein